MITKNASHTHKPLKALEKGDLCYRREFDGKKLVKIDDLCEVIKVTMTMTTNNKRAIIPRGQEGTNTRDIVTIKQHQERINREITDLENNRGGGQA